jgi:hypothetical protein
MSTENNQEEFMIIWEAPKIEPPEFRLYYDEHGAVVCYTGDKSVTGNYIVIDALTFAAARPDVRVIDGKISTVAPNAVVHKLMPNDDEGMECYPEDISIVIDKSYLGKTQKWKLTTYELR